MPATFEWSESNGESEVVTDGIQNINFGSIDAPELNPSQYPIVRGTNSYIKYIRAKFSGTFTEISNMKFWKSAGEYVTDEVITAGANVSYSTPTQDPSSDDPVPESEENALSIQASDGGNTITEPGYTKYIRLQAQIGSNAPPGATNEKEFSFQYDEV